MPNSASFWLTVAALISVCFQPQQAVVLGSDWWVIIKEHYSVKEANIWSWLRVEHNEAEREYWTLIHQEARDMTTDEI